MLCSDEFKEVLDIFALLFVFIVLELSSIYVARHISPLLGALTGGSVPVTWLVLRWRRIC